MRTRPPARLYLDDGFPESRDYDDNYVEVAPPSRPAARRGQPESAPARAQVGAPAAVMVPCGGGVSPA